MSLSISKALGGFFGVRKLTILMLGLEGAGKTTSLHRFNRGKDVTTISTIESNVETLTFENIKFYAWDVGGKNNTTSTEKQYSRAQGLIFVVDSNDRSRIEDANQELQQLLSDHELIDALLLVFANKQDLPNAMNAAEITDRLGLHSLRQRQWYIQSTSATTGDGLYEGLEWLSANIKKKEA